MINVAWILTGLYLFLIMAVSMFARHKTGEWQRGLYVFVIALTFPVVGLIFLWYSDFLSERQKDKDLHEFYRGDDFTPDPTWMMEKIDTAKELSHVTARDALAVNSYEYRRNLIMQFLSEEDTLQYLDILQMALENDDSETVHYASSVVMELQRKVTMELAALESGYAQRPEDTKLGLKWESALYKLLKSRLYSDVQLSRYKFRYQKVSDYLLERADESEDISKDMLFAHRIDIEVGRGNFTEGQEFCERYLHDCPESEDAVLCQMSLYVKQRAPELLQAFLATLSSRPVLLTQKTLQYIRVFRKERSA